MTDPCIERSSFFISKRAISKLSTRLCFHRTAQSANTRSHDDEKAAKSDAKFKHFLTMESAGLMGTNGWMGGGANTKDTFQIWKYSIWMYARAWM